MANALAEQEFGFYGLFTGRKEKLESVWFRTGAILVFLLLAPLNVSLAEQQTITLDLKDADVARTIRQLAEIGGLNVVISQEVQGTVTVRLLNVPVRDALEILLQTAGLTMVRKDSVIGILPLKTLLQMDMQDLEARRQGAGF
jgi:type II secretory pathway component HofQ